MKLLVLQILLKKHSGCYKIVRRIACFHCTIQLGQTGMTEKIVYGVAVACLRVGVILLFRKS